MPIVGKCPFCGTQFNNILPDICPNCHLEGVNGFFISQEDYLKWKAQNLEPQRKQLGRVFAGYDSVLILLGNGDLYGMGNNDQGRFCPDPKYEGEQLVKPTKIASGIRSAAAGYNYSLMVDKEGNVIFIGNSGVPYAERFQQPVLAKEVFAAPDRDIFWLTDEKDNLYSWGNNYWKDLQKHIETPLIPTIKITLPITISKSVWTAREDIERSYWKTSLEVRFVSGNHLYIKTPEIIQEILHINPNYTSLFKSYYQENIDISYRVLNSTLLDVEASKEWDDPKHMGEEWEGEEQVYHDTLYKKWLDPEKIPPGSRDNVGLYVRDYIWHFYYSRGYGSTHPSFFPTSIHLDEHKVADLDVSVNLVNRYLFIPTQDECCHYSPLSIQSGSGLVRTKQMTESFPYFKQHQNERKTILVKKRWGKEYPDYLLRCINDGVLELIDEDQQIRWTCNNVADCSEANGVIYIISYDQILYRGDSENIYKKGFTVLTEVFQFNK